VKRRDEGYLTIINIHEVTGIYVCPVYAHGSVSALNVMVSKCQGYGMVSLYGEKENSLKKVQREQL